jgi:succinyl-CoA synthetase beta subunit
MAKSSGGWMAAWQCVSANATQPANDSDLGGCAPADGSRSSVRMLTHENDLWAVDTARENVPIRETVSILTDT